MDGYGKKFCPRGAVEEIMNPSSVARHLASSFPHDKTESLVRYICTWARNLFAILILIGKSSTIAEFQAMGIQDHHLPLRVTERRGFEASRILLGGEGRIGGKGRIANIIFHTWEHHAVDSFDLYQWGFMAPNFFLDVNGRALHYQLDDKIILPWVDCRRVADSASSRIHKVSIHPAHFEFGNLVSLSDLLTSSSDYLLIHTNNDTQYPKPTFAIKEFRSTKNGAFEREISSLNGLPQHKHLNMLLASYQWQQLYYLLFPWATASLQELWTQRSPDPVVSDDQVEWMLRQCHGITHALAMIHEPSAYPSQEGVILHAAGEQTFLLRHGDIKPQNILWFEDEATYMSRPRGHLGTLKISDFGSTQIHLVATEKRGATTESGEWTEMYSGPEMDHPGLPMSRSSDIWSLGCVYLEFITWLLMGAKGLEDFRERRMQDSQSTSNFRTGAFWGTSYQEKKGDGDTTIDKGKTSRSLYADTVVKKSVANVSRDTSKSDFLQPIITATTISGLTLFELASTPNHILLPVSQLCSNSSRQRCLPWIPQRELLQKL